MHLSRSGRVLDRFPVSSPRVLTGWLLVCMYSSEVEMQHAAQRYNGQWLEAADAVWQAAPTTTEIATGEDTTHPYFFGVMRFTVPVVREWLLHESVHAACTAFRMRIASEIHLPEKVASYDTDPEEHIAWMAGGFAAAIQDRLLTRGHEIMEGQLT